MISYSTENCSKVLLQQYYNCNIAAILHYNISKGGHFPVVTTLQQRCSNITAML